MPEEIIVSSDHLGEGEIVIERCYGNIPAVEDFCPRHIRIQSGAGIEATERCLSGGRRTDCSRAESCA